MLHFATLFDINYLSRGLALYKSLVKHCTSPFTLYVLCLDSEVSRNLRNQENLRCVELAELENHFTELTIAKKNRSKYEYYFTLSPYWPLYLLETRAEIGHICTMDADLYFFDNPQKIFDCYPKASILITPHNFSDEMRDLIEYGKFNVSFQYFKRDDAGLACLQDWRKSCYDWCKDYYDKVNSRYADQKYLDKWPSSFKNVQAIEMNGTGLAPWNINKFDYQIKQKRVLINGSPLIYYHFHHLRIFNNYFAINGFSGYQVSVKHKALSIIYHSYLKALKSFTKNIDNNIGRATYRNSGNLLSKLLKTDGYWFFSNFFIFRVNLYRTLLPLAKIWRN